MTFANKIKQEIMAKDLTKTKLYSLVNGIIISSARLNEDFYALKFNNKDILIFLVEMLNLLQIDYAIIKNQKQIVIPKTQYKLEINYTDNASFFAGVFLGSGSINKISSTSYHLQISTFDYQMSVQIMNKLNTYENFNFKILNQANKYVLYLKKIEAICDFLRAIEAPNSYLALENEKIERDFQNNLNRLGNIDITNIQKTVIAFQEFETMYKLVRKKRQLKHFTNDQITYFKLRIKYPELSLSSLVDELNNQKINITKSGLNHWNRKLKRVFKKIKV